MLRYLLINTGLSNPKIIPNEPPFRQIQNEEEVRTDEKLAIGEVN